MSMKLLSGLLLLASWACAQPPTTSVRRDSVPERGIPHTYSSDFMPNARPRNSFYRYPVDLPNVKRATLDNMSVKTPDSSANYTMLRSFRKRVKPEEPPMTLPKPVPQVVVPKKF